LFIFVKIVICKDNLVIIARTRVHNLVLSQKHCAYINLFLQKLFIVS